MENEPDILPLQDDSPLQGLPVWQRWVVIFGVLLLTFVLFFYCRAYSGILKVRTVRLWVGGFLSLLGAFGTMAFTMELKGRDGKPHILAPILGSIIGIAIIAGAEILARRVPYPADTTRHYLLRDAVAFLFMAGAPWAGFFGSREQGRR